jgi:hypothetical protein
MKSLIKFVNFVIIISLLALTGCASMHTASTSGTATATDTESAKNEPYFPTNFNDFEVPGELKIDSKHTMFINTSSFTGGIIAFSGRVEITSLADYFINSMQKNNWTLTGEVRYNNILLAFTKPNKNCMISIYGDSYNYKTKVNVYITENSQLSIGQ